MGRVKDHFHEEICAMANSEPWGPEPSEEEIAKFYSDVELERARELIGRAASAAPRLKEDRHEPR